MCENCLRSDITDALTFAFDVYIGTPEGEDVNVSIQHFVNMLVEKAIKEDSPQRGSITFHIRVQERKKDE